MGRLGHMRQNPVGQIGNRTSHDPAVLADLTRDGRLRAALKHGNPVLVQRDPAGGEPCGVSPELARELARRLGVELEFVHFDAAGKVFDAIPAGVWDVAFLAIDPARAAGIEFTAPYVIIEGSYLVRERSPFLEIGDLDRPGVTIAVGRSAGATYLRSFVEEMKINGFIAHALRASGQHDAIVA